MVQQKRAFCKRLHYFQFYVFIENSHAEYLKFKRSVEEDVRYIVDLCRQVVQVL